MGAQRVAHGSVKVTTGPIPGMLQCVCEAQLFVASVDVHADEGSLMVGLIVSSRDARMLL